jgi:hypothetical protein
VPSTLDEIIKEINKHVTIKAHVPKPKPAIQTAVMVTGTAAPEPETDTQYHAAAYNERMARARQAAPKSNSGSELELMTFNPGATDPESSKHTQAPPTQGVNLGKFDSRMHHLDHYL